MAIRDIHWFDVYNDSGEEIPAFGIMRMSGIDDLGVLKVAKPNTDGQTDVLVNSPVPIPIGKYGQGHRNSPCAVYYDTANTPAAAETWGAAASSWKLTKNKAGGKIIGGVVSPIVTVGHNFGGSGSSGDELAKVSSDDTTAGYLNGKLVAGAGITFTENNPAGNETLTISSPTYAGVLYLRRFTFVYTDFNVALPEVTIPLLTLPSLAVLMGVFAETITPFAGTGYVQGRASVGLDAVDQYRYIAYPVLGLNLDTTPSFVSSGAGASQSTAALPETLFANAFNLDTTVTLIGGANGDDLTAGEYDVVVMYTIMPA